MTTTGTTTTMLKYGEERATIVHCRTNSSRTNKPKPKCDHNSSDSPLAGPYSSPVARPSTTIANGLPHSFFVHPMVHFISISRPRPPYTRLFAERGAITLLASCSAARTEQKGANAARRGIRQRAETRERERERRT